MNKSLNQAFIRAYSKDKAAEKRSAEAAQSEEANLSEILMVRYDTSTVAVPEPHFIKPRPKAEALRDSSPSTSARPVAAAQVAKPADDLRDSIASQMLQAGQWQDDFGNTAVGVLPMLQSAHARPSPFRQVPVAEQPLSGTEPNSPAAPPAISNPSESAPSSPSFGGESPVPQAVQPTQPAGPTQSDRPSIPTTQSPPVEPLEPIEPTNAPSQPAAQPAAGNQQTSDASQSTAAPSQSEKRSEPQPATETAQIGEARETPHDSGASLHEAASEAIVPVADQTNQVRAATPPPPTTIRDNERSMQKDSQLAAEQSRTRQTGIAGEILRVDPPVQTAETEIPQPGPAVVTRYERPPFPSRPAAEVGQQYHRRDHGSEAKTRALEEDLRRSKTRIFNPVWEVDNLQWPEVCVELLEQTSSDMDAVTANLVSACEEGLQVLAVTSPQSGEGRTTVACCLAMLAGSRGLKVAIVDGDIENPSISYQTNLEIDQDWKSALIKQLPLEEISVHSIDDQVTLVPLLQPIGQAEMSTDDNRIAYMLQELTESFDLVIVDMGHMASNRSLVMSLAQQGIINAVVAVADRRHSDQRQIDSCVRRIRQAGVSSIGLVENFAA